ncbi:pentapeptide repeat-containing protein [bacterium]|jgi:uncharacterized protein YjbI with pentapeptide repeats|nr:pentapeptide repeat-containing protein [bacterium]
MTFCFRIIFAILFCLSNLIKADFILINNDPLVPIGAWGTWQNKDQAKLLVREVLPAGGMTNIPSSIMAGVTHLWITQNFGISGGSVFPMPQNNDCVYSIPSPDCAADNYLQSMSFGTNTQKLQPESWCYTPENIPSGLNITPNWFVTKRNLSGIVINSFASVGQVFDIKYSPLASPGTAANPSYNPEDSVFTGETGDIVDELTSQNALIGKDFSNQSISSLMANKIVKVGLFQNCTFDGADMGEMDLDSKTFLDCSFKGTKFQGSSLNSTTFKIIDDKNVDFSNADLTGSFLVGAKISNGKFAGTTLDSADFNSAILQNSDFTGIKSWGGADFTGGASFSGCTFSNVPFAGIKYDSTTNFSGSIMHGAIFAGKSATSLSSWQGINLSGADLTSANFSYANLDNSKMVSATLTNANFTGASLTGANFSIAYGSPRTNLTSAKFIGANLNGANFTASNLTESNFENALLHGAKFDSSIMKNVSISKASYRADSANKLPQANFDSANFSSSTNLSNIDFSGLSFSQTRFSSCTMEKASFNSSNLSGVQFDHTNLESSEFKNATISGTTNFGIIRNSGTPTNLSKANFTGSDFSNGSYILFDSASMKNVKMNSTKFNSPSFDNATLDGSDFGSASLGSATFSGSMKNVKMRYATLSDVCFGSKASMPNADLSYADLSGNTSFRDIGTCKTVILNHANFAGADLRYFNFSGNQNLQDVTFDGANFDNINHYTNFENTNLTGSTFKHISNGKAIFNGANLSGVNFYKSKLDGSSFCNAISPTGGVTFEYASCNRCDFRGVDFYTSAVPEIDNHFDANFEHASLINSKFGNYKENETSAPSNKATISITYEGTRYSYTKYDYTKLNYASFENANLTYASFSGCYKGKYDVTKCDSSYKTDMTGVKISGANLSNADLRCTKIYKLSGASSVNSMNEALYYYTYFDSGYLESKSSYAKTYHMNHVEDDTDGNAAYNIWLEGAANAGLATIKI